MHVIHPKFWQGILILQLITNPSHNVMKTLQTHVTLIIIASQVSVYVVASPTLNS